MNREIREIRERELDERRLMRPATHSILVDGRERIAITGINDVDSFNEQEVIMVSDLGGLRIIGQNLHITKINLEEGQVVIEGLMVGLEYEHKPERRQGGFFSRLFG